MRRFFSFVKSLFAGIVGLAPEVADKMQDGMIAIKPYLPRAYEIASVVAALTPTRIDDEILAAAQKLGVDPADALAQKAGTKLRDLAAAALRKAFPQATDKEINRAIEVAMGAVE